MPMNDEEIALWLKGLAEGMRARGRFDVVAIIALPAERKDIFLVMSPTSSVETFQTLLRKVLEVPTEEIEVGHEG